MKQKGLPNRQQAARDFTREFLDGLLDDETRISRIVEQKLRQLEPTFNHLVDKRVKELIK